MSPRKRLFMTICAEPAAYARIIRRKRGEDVFLWFILLDDFTCCETRLHNADRFNRMITLGSIQRHAV